MICVILGAVPGQILGDGLGWRAKYTLVYRSEGGRTAFWMTLGDFVLLEDLLSMSFWWLFSFSDGIKSESLESKIIV